MFAPGMNLTDRTEVELIVFGFTSTDAEDIAKGCLRDEILGLPFADLRK